MDKLRKITIYNKINVIMKKTDKQLLFERMNKVTGMPLNENYDEEIDVNKINYFVSKLPNDFPNLVRKFSEDKNIGLDSAYYQFLGTYMDKLGIDLNDDEVEELSTHMYGRYGDDYIEF